MTFGLGVRVFNTTENTAKDYSFRRLPVRIGRNPLNDLQLDFPFVSQFHAVLELHDNVLVLRDLGSTNGTTVRGGVRVPTGQVVSLADSNFEFGIVSLYFRTFTAEVSDQLGQPPRSKLGVTSMILAQHARPPGGLGSNRVEEVAARQAGLYGDYRATWVRFLQGVAAGLSELEPAARAPFIQRVAQAFPAVSNEPEFKSLAGQYGVSLAGEPSGPNASSVALQGLQELARDFLPNRNAPESIQELAAFVERLQITLDVFLRSFVPLRDGYKQFEREMGIRRSDGRSPAPGERITVSSARDAKELASLLLDWNNRGNESSAAIESSFADIMIHQVAILNGVMTGARKLLMELAPQTVDAALSEGRVRSAGFFHFGPFRNRALWKAYEERYGDVAEERVVFDHLFGPVFSRISENARPERHGDDPQNPAPRAPSNWPNRD